MFGKEQYSTKENKRKKTFIYIHSRNTIWKGNVWGRKKITQANETKE